MQDLVENINAIEQPTKISLFAMDQSNKNPEEVKLIKDYPQNLPMGMTSDKNEPKNRSHKIHVTHSKDQMYFLPGIPDEIALEILTYLDKNDLKNTLFVNKKWFALSRDVTLWKKFFNKYTQGFLWQYLFKMPDISAYKTYFLDVFSISDLSYENFEDFFIKLVKEKFISEKKTLDPGRLSVKQSYFKDLESNKIKAQLTDIIESIKKIPETARQNYLSAFQTKIDLGFEDYQKALPILFRVAELDTLLTDLIYMWKFCNLDKRYMSWFFNKENVMLSARAIVALSAYSGSTILQTVFEKPELWHLFTKFTRTELIQCIDLDLMATLTILKNPKATNLFTENDLVIFFKKLLNADLQKNFYYLLDNNPSLLIRMNGNFLVNLTEKVRRFKFITLAHPKLLNNLSDEQLIKIFTDISYECLDILNNETFVSFLEKKTKTLLMTLPNLSELIENDRIALCLDAEDVFSRAMKCSIKIGEALAQQNILVKKLNNRQLTTLALKHPQIAINLLKNPILKDSWTIATLEMISNQTKGYKNWEAKIEELVIQQKRYILQKKQESNTARVSHENIHFDKMNKARSITFVTPSTQSKGPSEAMLSAEDDKPKLISYYLWKILGVTGLILLTLIGISLTATGIGAALGVPFAIGIISALNVFNISLSTLTLGCIVLGTVSALIPIATSIQICCKLSLKNLFKTTKQERNFTNESSQTPHYGLIRAKLQITQDKSVTNDPPLSDYYSFNSFIPYKPSKFSSTKKSPQLEKVNDTRSTQRTWLSHSL